MTPPSLLVSSQSEADNTAGDRFWLASGVEDKNGPVSLGFVFIP